MKWAMTVMVVAFATEAGAQSAGVRDVTASESEIVTLNTQIRFTTMLVLPDGEEIIELSGGDVGEKGRWVVEMSRNVAHVKPTSEKSTTNLNLVTTSGAIYSFLLKEVSGSGTQPDLRVNVAPDPKKATHAAPKYVPTATVDACREELARVRESTSAQLRLAAKSSSDVADQAPLAMKFPYQIALNTAPFLVRGMWTDGTFTYLQADGQELPALYELKDEKPSLVQFSVKDGVYVVPKVLADGYLQLGKTKAPFKVRDEH